MGQQIKFRTGLKSPNTTDLRMWDSKSTGEKSVQMCTEFKTPTAFYYILLFDIIRTSLITEVLLIKSSGVSTGDLGSMEDLDSHKESLAVGSIWI